MKKILISASLTVLVGGAFFVTSDKNEVSGKKINEVVTLKTENVLSNGKIKHTVIKDHQDSKELEIKVNMNEGKLTKEDMDVYKEQNNKNIIKLSKLEANVPTTVTFNASISVEKFEKLVSKHNIKVQNFNIIAKDNNNMDIFIQGVPKADNTVPQDKLTDSLRGGEFVGIYSF